MTKFQMSRERESTVEDEAIVWAENNGWIARHMAYRGRRGCRDVDFYGHGQVVMMEFKRRGGVESAGQRRERQRLADKGLTVHVVSDVQDAIAILRAKSEG